MTFKLQKGSAQNRYQKLRRNTRMFLVQCFYAWDFSQDHAKIIVARVREVLNAFQEQANVASQALSLDIDDAYFDKIFHILMHHCMHIDERLTPCLARPLPSLGGVERAILRLATIELSQECSVPCKVVINESVELAKDFGATESFKFINGALHALSQKRPFSLVL